jgi:carbamoylphosphate synthase large subunit
LTGWASLIAKKIGLIGGVNIQFIGDYFIEVNPRLPGGLGLVSLAGFNMSKLAIKAFFGLLISDKEKRFKKTKVLRVWKDVLYER